MYQVDVEMGYNGLRGMSTLCFRLLWAPALACWEGCVQMGLLG